MALLGRIELPRLAGPVDREDDLPGTPLVVEGLRIATVQVIATATLGALVAWGGLGRYIVDGFALQEPDQVVAGAILIALLAIAVDVAFGVLTRVLTPRQRSAGSASAIRDEQGRVPA